MKMKFSIANWRFFGISFSDFAQIFPMFIARTPDYDIWFAGGNLRTMVKIAKFGTFMVNIVEMYWN